MWWSDLVPRKNLTWSYTFNFLQKIFILKPSFSIIKDEKAKDKVGVGDKPPTPKFQQFDQVWSNLIKFDPIYSNLIQFDQVCDKLNQV